MKASEFTTEDNFGTHPKRPARTGSRHPRGHEPVPRYKTITAQDSDNTAESVAEGPTKDPNAPKLVQDRKTGKWYDPNKEFEKKMTSPKVMAQMKRMAQKEGVAEASYMSVDDYKNNLQKALPSIIEYYQDELGFIPSKEQLASAVKAAHATMERTGDTEQAGESLEAVLDSFVPSNASNKNSPKIDFKKNLLQVLQQKYPDAEFKIGPDRVESTDGQLSVIADTAQEGRYVGCFMWDVSTGPYKGVLGLAVKQTTDQLLRANPGKKPALFIGGDNQNPEAWSHIAKKLKYKLITDEDELEEGFGINYPGTYEQENNMYKGHGQRRIGNLTSENIDSELINVLQYAQQHYPNSKNKQEAFMKFVQRALGHSKSDDERQDNELERLDKEVDQLQKQVNVTESTDYLEEK